jgi:hypothetical protein
MPCCLRADNTSTRVAVVCAFGAAGLAFLHDARLQGLVPGGSPLADIRFYPHVCLDALLGFGPLQGFERA